MVIAIDLDGVLCKEKHWKHLNEVKPLEENIEKVNKLFELGHEIVIYSARIWYDFQMTKTWLDKNNVKYNRIELGKYPYDKLVDDKAMTLNKLLKEVRNEAK